MNARRNHLDVVAGVLDASIRFADRTEDALAEALVDAHRDARWVDDWGRWYLWDGKRWARDSVLTMFDRARELCRVAASAQNEQGGVRSAKTVAAIERLARSDRRVVATVDQWDRDGSLLNTPRGIFDLAAGAMARHDPDGYMTRITRGTPGAEDWRELAPRFAQFLDELTMGDAELAAYLQRLAGYGCVGSSKEHVLPFWKGPGGNGKGTLAELLVWTLGDYAITMPENFLAEQKGERHPTELIDLRGARFAVCSETTAGAAWNEARLKALTGGDTLKARAMRQDFVSFMPTHTLVVVSNNAPRLRSVDDAIRRRIQVVPLTAKVTKPDLNLLDKLKAEADGVLTWATHGALEWLNDGLRPPQAVLEASAMYFDSQDPLAEFIEEECDTGPQWETSVTPLYKRYKAWAEEQGHFALGRTGFGDELEKRGFPRRRGGGGTRFHRGIVLNQP